MAEHSASLREAAGGRADVKSSAGSTQPVYGSDSKRPNLTPEASKTLRNMPAAKRDDGTAHQSSVEGEAETVPDKAKDIAEQVKNNNGTPLKGYKGGKEYQNNPTNGGEKLPDGIKYREYDVDPYIKGQGRGTERIVIGDDGSVWYTDDHYNTFTKVEWGVTNYV